MPNPTFVILYVDDATASAAFYAGLLGRDPVDAAPSFAMFAISPELMLGLWTRSMVLPAAAATFGGGEVALPVDGAAAVDARHADWGRRGIAILQEPTDMEFGRTFVAADPDGHRLRVFAPAAA